MFLFTLTLQIQVGQSLIEEEQEEDTRDYIILKVASSLVADHIAFS